MPRPLVPASPALSDVNMAFVSQGAAAALSGSSPPRHRDPSPADARDEERAGTAGTAAGAGSPSRAAAITSRALLRLAMARAAVPGPGAAELGSSGLSAAAPTALRVPRRDKERRPGRGEEPQPRPGATQRPCVCPQLRTSDSSPRSHLSPAGGGGSGAGMPRCADSAEPRPAEINKEAGDQLRSRPVPNAPGLPLQPLRALHEAGPSRSTGPGWAEPAG